jgi:Zn-dependent protease with chaperone function
MAELLHAQPFLLVALGLYLGFGLLVSLITRPVVRGTEGWSPVARHRTLLAFGALPAFLAALSTFAVLLPSVLAGFWPQLDHCLVHRGHVHLCLHHPFGPAGGWSSWIVAAGLAWLLAVIGIELEGWFSARRWLATIRATGHWDPKLSAWVLPVAQPICLTLGALHPVLVLSRGFLESASPAELGVALSHERAHVLRRDGLINFLARLLTLSLLPRSRRRLLSALELAGERSCDEAAAAAVGDRLQVAEALLAMEQRLSGAPPPEPFAVGLGPSSVPERIEALLRPPSTRDPSWAWALVFLAAAAICIYDFQGVHHRLESILSLAFP